jgi:uncharacterized membrane protein
MIDHQQPVPEKTPQNEVIRSRLLFKLGIQKSLTDANAIVASTPDPGVNLLRRDDRPVFRQSLNDSSEENLRTSQPHRTSRKRLVKFDTDVLVQPIASHKNYSKRIKKTLWADREELQDSASRNQAEFAAEGYDFEKVLEDEDMYIDAETGELVHPYWIEGQGKESS